MKVPLLRLVLIVPLMLVLAAGCKKKDEDTIADEREASLPPEERVAPVPEKDKEKPGNDFAAEAAAFEAWCKKYKLDANDPKMLDADPDNDGFLNRDEFVGNTDPGDPKSRPGIHSTIRLVQYNEVRFPMILESVDGNRAKIRPAEGDAKPQDIRAGETVHGMKVERIEEKHDTDKGGQPIDISSVTLENPATKERVILVKNVPSKTSASHAVLASADGKTTIKVKIGETFEWPGEPGAHYKVIDMSEDQVVVQHVETRKPWTILKD